MREFHHWSAGHSPQEPSQPQSASLARMHVCSPSLEGPIFSQNRMPTRSYFSEESGDESGISHRLESSVQGQSSERGLDSYAEEEAHQLGGATNSVSGSKTFYALSAKSSCIGPDG